MIPRNYSFTGKTPSKNFAGLHWQSRYAMVGVNVKYYWHYQ